MATPHHWAITIPASMPSRSINRLAEQWRDAMGPDVKLIVLTQGSTLHWFDNETGRWRPLPAAEVGEVERLLADYLGDLESVDGE